MVLSKEKKNNCKLILILKSKQFNNAFTFQLKEALNGKENKVQIYHLNVVLLGGRGGEVSIEVEEIIENLFKICSYYKNSSYNKKNICLADVSYSLLLNLQA